jgi:hypothetical protein
LRAGTSAKVIAAELGFSRSYISTKATKIRLEPKRIPDRDLAYLREEASRRGLTVHGLRARIVQAVVRGRLIDAVLDDAAVFNR